jgi:hypothetical protein
MMKKNRLRAGPVVAISTLTAITLAGMMLVSSPQVRAQNDNTRGSDSEFEIQQGFAIAPVPLNLVGKDPTLVLPGSYIVNAQGDCNGCHARDPAVEFTPTENPYLLSPPFSGKVTTDPTHYLAGGRDFGPFPGGPGGIPHLYTRNLTPDKTALPEGGHTLPEFLQIMRHGTDFDHHSPKLYQSRYACELPAVSVQWESSTGDAMAGFSKHDRS